MQGFGGPAEIQVLSDGGEVEELAKVDVDLVSLHWHLQGMKGTPTALETSDGRSM